MLSVRRISAWSLLALAGAALSGPLQGGRGGPLRLAVPRAHAEEAQAPWEREVERARREQDRQIKSAKRQKIRLDTVIRRYTQQVRNETSALNHYLLGRVHWYDERPEEAVKQMQRALQLDRNFYFGLFGK